MGVGSSFLIFICSTWLLLVQVDSTITQLSYTQKLNHFGFDNRTFQQRLYFDNTFWGGAGNPIFVFFCGESPIDVTGTVGLLNESGHRFRALTVYIEHRFYGNSVPFQSLEVAFADPEVRGCLTSEQALQDFSEIILSLKVNLSATSSPVVVMGGSYSGMLAAWFRLKYPHITHGALASSAPILSFSNVSSEYAACEVVDNDFKEVNPKCHSGISHSWTVIDGIASKPGGLELLSDTFNTCEPLQSSGELKMFVSQAFFLAAQYNGRYNYWISSICDEFLTGSDAVKGLSNVISFAYPGKNCQNMLGGQSNGESGLFPLDFSSMKAWNWQLCSEFVVPTSCGSNLMLPASKFDPQGYFESCRQIYGVSPRPMWVESYYGGRDINTTLKDFGSNIIFSNGLMDPLSSGGVLKDLSETIVAITTTKGSHCLDLAAVAADDPDWLKEQREQEMRVIGRWIRSSSGSKLTVICAVLPLLISLGLLFDN